MLAEQELSLPPDKKHNIQMSCMGIRITLALRKIESTGTLPVSGEQELSLPPSAEQIQSTGTLPALEYIYIYMYLSREELLYRGAPFIEDA